MEYCIRVATDNDKKPLTLLMKEHALYEGGDIEIHKHQKMNNLKALPVIIYVVERKDNLIGYMSVIKQFSTWGMNWYLYLDCLYLTEATRGYGIGLKLMQKLKEIAEFENINVIQWQTPEDNHQAIKFYHKLGAINKVKQRFFWSI